MTITDSLNRREVLYTEGEGGLKRVVKKEHADGSITRSEYDEAGEAEGTDGCGGAADGVQPAYGVGCGDGGDGAGRQDGTVWL